DRLEVFNKFGDRRHWIYDPEDSELKEAYEYVYDCQDQRGEILYAIDMIDDLKIASGLKNDWIDDYCEENGIKDRSLYQAQIEKAWEEKINRLYEKAFLTGVCEIRYDW